MALRNGALLLPRQFLRMRNALEHVAEFMSSWNGSELADQFLVDGVVAHALDDWHCGPGVGHQLDHVVGERGALYRISFCQQLLYGGLIFLAGCVAGFLVADQMLVALRLERAIV